ncbi:MAG: hypothetical protein R6U96_02745 [Promethearchaeia archaeon]
MELFLIFIVLFIICAGAGLWFYIKNGERYGIVINIVFPVIGFVILTVISFFTLNLFNLGTLSKTAARNFLILSILARTYSLSIIGSLYYYFFKKNLLAPMLYAFFTAIISIVVFLPNSFNLIKIGTTYILQIKTPSLLYILVSFNLSIIILMWGVHILNYKVLKQKKMAKVISLVISIFTLVVTLYLLYLIFSNLWLKFVFDLSFLTSFATFLYFLISHPNFYYKLTNQVDNLILFHKSGILLYSYDFNKNEQLDDSLLKGAILIGINHILSNLAIKEYKLNSINLKDKRIILRYNDKLGFAFLLIVERSSRYLKSCVENFLKDFSEKFREDLLDLNGLVDSSKFKNTKRMIQQNFAPYL